MDGDPFAPAGAQRDGPGSAGALVEAFVRFNDDDDAAGAARFASGKGRHGDFGSI
jgi:hypothetical protein